LEPATLLEQQPNAFVRQKSVTRRFAALDDDDEDDAAFDEKGPLAKGIDSVSWLPSVAGAKGDNMPITSMEKVRDKTCSSHATRARALHCI